MRNEILNRVHGFFNAVDERDWAKCAEIMADRVLLDYTSMAGGDPALLAPGAIIESWKGLLPGFDQTHHQLGNEVVTVDDDEADLFAYVTATHYIAEEVEYVWTVVGSYDIRMKRIDGAWKITALKLNFKYQDGNSDLPAKAQARVK